MTDEIQRRVLEEVLVLQAGFRMLLGAVTTPDAVAETDAILERHREKIREFLATTFPEPATAEPVELPAACREETEEHCARRNPEALLELGRKDGGTYQRMCRGCGSDPLSGG